MDKTIFFALYNIIAKNEKLHKLPKIIIKIATCLISAIYFVVGIRLIMAKDFGSINYFIIPVAVFGLTTAIRIIINRPRPFDVFDITPFISHKSGQSLPSRHTVSGFIMALAILGTNLYLGVFAIILSLIIGVVRVMAGVHYPSDILTSIILCLLCSGFLLQ